MYTSDEKTSIIKCPKCKTDKGLILESPSWVHYKNDVINVNCTCVDCSVSFEVDVILGKVTDTINIRENYHYPYSA